MSLFEAMVEAKIFRNAISFNAAISSCEKSGRWQEALGVFWEAQLEGVQTNVRCLVVVCQ